MRVPVTDLVGRPGATRRHSASVAHEDVGADPWGPAEEALTGPIGVDVQLDSVVEGIFVHGTVTFTLELPCGRCLEPVVVDREVPVSELFQDPNKLEEGDELEPGYELVGDRSAIDLERMLHDVVLLDLPVRVICERAGCTTTGAVEADVAVRTEEEDLLRRSAQPDPRWSRLADLDLPGD